MEIGPDGVVRQLQPFGPLPPMSYLLAMRSGAPRDWDLFRRRGENEPLPLDFHGPPGSIPSVSASALLRTPALAGMLGLQDKVVIIGATYEESRDLMLTPYSTRGRASTEESGKPVESSGYYRPFYGVELLATATQTIMDGALRQSHEGFDAETVDFTLLLLVCAGVILLARRGVAAGVSVALTVLGGSAALAIYSALVAPDASWIAGLLGHRFHPAGPFWIGAPLAAAAGIAWRQMDQARELQQVREAFGAYVGSEILENLGGRMPELGGEVQPIAVLFCDIRGYSALAERMRDDPKTLMAELNDHFHPLVNTLKARGAYVDNYVGDLVMALFGAPTGGNVTDAARQAARAALDFVDVVHKRNEKRREQGLPAIEIGVGVHCGEAVVGNLGSLDGGGGKIHYTAIGDTVNLASRVESSTRKYEVPLLVTEELVNACRAGSPDDGLHLPEWEFVAETTVKGRETPVRLYRPKS
jgi:adenylate cyclase